MLKSLVPISIVIGAGLAVVVEYAPPLMKFMPAAETVVETPKKLEVSAKIDPKGESRKISYDDDPRLERVAELLAQRGWMCGKVINVKHVKGNRTDIIHFIATCIEADKEAGVGTLRRYFISAAINVVQTILDNRTPGRKGFVDVRLLERQDLVR